jgi:hypothetical protein
VYLSRTRSVACSISCNEQTVTRGHADGAAILPNVRDQFLVWSLRRSPAGTATFTELVPSAAKMVM